MADPQDNHIGEHQDPSPETTAQIVRMVGQLEKLLLTRLHALEETQRRFEESITRVPTEVQKAVGNLREVLDQKFATFQAKIDGLESVSEGHLAALNVQFAERDTRTGAALLSAKEAVAKSEVSTAKQLDQQSDLLRTLTGGLGDQISDLKIRVTGIESRTQGISLATLEARQVRDSGVGQGGFIAAIVFGIMSLLIGIAGVVIAFSHSNTPAREERIFEVPAPQRQQQ